MKKSRFRKINRILEMPAEIYSENFKITIIGFDEIIIENFKGILEYEENYVKIKTFLGIINISGYELNLENLTNDDIKVKGKIESIEFDKMMEENNGN